MGLSTYCFVEQDGTYNIYSFYTKKGKDFFAKISLKDKTLKEIPLPFSYFINIKSYKEKIVFVAGS